jgi:ATP-binding protein involved in chromosome partitioning
MTDPRIEILGSRFENIKNIIAVSSGKGGVGKSVIATAISLVLSEKGFNVGLLDLDFTSPSTHVILGVKGLYPKEEYGIIPPLAHGLRYMSIVHYSIDKPAPLRGSDISDAIIELLAITRWGELDYLIIDMPPGIGDVTLDVMRLIPRIRFIVVTTPSKVAYETVRKQLVLFKRLKVPIIGVIENMVLSSNKQIKLRVEDDGANYVGEIRFDGAFEDSIGNVSCLKGTEFYSSVKILILNLFE